MELIQSRRVCDFMSWKKCVYVSAKCLNYGPGLGCSLWDDCPVSEQLESLSFSLAGVKVLILQAAMGISCCFLRMGCLAIDIYDSRHLAQRCDDAE